MPYYGNHCIIEKNQTITGVNERGIKKTLKDDVEVLSYLNTTVEIAKDVNLLDVFYTVKNLPILKLIISRYSCCPKIDEFHEQAISNPIDNKSESKLVIQGSLDIGNNDNPNVSINYDLLISTPYKLDEENFYDKNNCEKCKRKIEHDHEYSASYENLNKLAKMKIKIEENCKIRYNFILFNKINKKEIKEIKINPTLLEFLDIIYDEISFHHSPNETMIVKANLKNMLKQIEQLK